MSASVRHPILLVHLFLGLIIGHLGIMALAPHDAAPAAHHADGTVMQCGVDESQPLPARPGPNPPEMLAPSPAVGEPIQGQTMDGSSTSRHIVSGAERRALWQVFLN